MLDAKKIMHRDLKPENIMITKNLKVKLIDFGLGKKATQTLTLQCGTGGYMAPEMDLQDP